MAGGVKSKGGKKGRKIGKGIRKALHSRFKTYAGIIAHSQEKKLARAESRKKKLARGAERRAAARTARRDARRAERRLRRGLQTPQESVSVPEVQQAPAASDGG